MPRRTRPNPRLLLAAAASDRAFRLCAVAVVATIGLFITPAFLDLDPDRIRLAPAVAMSLLWLSGFAMMAAAARATGCLLGSAACCNCGYDRMGAVDQRICPECGHDAGAMRSAIDSTTAHRLQREARRIPIAMPIAIMTSLSPIITFLLEVNWDSALRLILCGIWGGASGYAAACIGSRARWRRFEFDSAAIETTPQSPNDPRISARSFLTSDIIPPPNARLIRAAMMRDRIAHLFVVAVVAAVVGALVSNRYIANRDVFALCASFGFLSLLGFVLATNAAAGRLLGSSACRKCGYDRRGISSNNPCPECGSDAGTMRADIGMSAVRHHRGCVLRVVIGIPVACFTSFWPLAIPWLPAAMHLQDLEELLILLLFMTWVIPAGAATAGLRNLVRWRRFQTDLHHDLSLAARTTAAPSTPHPRQPPDARPDARENARLSDSRFNSPSRRPAAAAKRAPHSTSSS